MRIAYVSHKLVHHLSPEPDLFISSLAQYSELSNPIYQISSRPEIDRLESEIKSIDILCIDWETLKLCEAESADKAASIVFARTENEFYSECLIERCQALLDSRTRLLALARQSEITTVLFMGHDTDPWNYTLQDYLHATQCLYEHDMHLWCWPLRFMPKGKNSFYHETLCNQSAAIGRFIELRHSIDVDYDQGFCPHKKDILIGCMPSFKPNRIKLYKQVQSIMSPSACDLMNSSMQSISLLKKHIRNLRLDAGISKKPSPELVSRSASAMSQAKNNYKAMLRRSCFIFTEAVAHSKVRKYLEIPFAGAFLCSEINGWENDIFNGAPYPVINIYQGQIGLESLSGSYNSNLESGNLLKISNKVKDQYSYRKRLERLEAAFY
jgi:hypothetical protein